MNETLVAFCFGIIVGIAIFVAAASGFAEHTVLYKQGQVDALTGKVAFELKQQKDGSTQWERIKK